MTDRPDERWLRRMGFGKDIAISGLAVPTNQDFAAAEWVLGQLIHYPPQKRSSYICDRETVALALASAREQGLDA